ncbi:MAG: NHLP bacteriocin export ABC transporter permease/ATPase subunit [Puniceicoccaceae bacterium]
MREERVPSGEPIDLRLLEGSRRILAGRVDLFASGLDEAGRPAGPRLPIGSLGPGDWFSGPGSRGSAAAVPPDSHRVGILAVGRPGTDVAVHPAFDDEAVSGEKAAELRAGFRKWIETVGSLSGRSDPPGDAPPRPADPADGSETPGSPRECHAALLAQARGRLEEEEETRRKKIAGRDRAGERAFTRGLRRITAFLSPGHTAPPPEPAAADDPLAAACARVLAAAGVAEVRLRPAEPGRTDTAERIADHAREAGAGHRVVLLDRPRWWREDNGPLLAFEGAGERPVALLPRRSGGYDLEDPETGSRRRVTAEQARSLKREAHMFFAGLPDRPARLRDMARVGFRGMASDLRAVVFFGCFAGSLALAIPIGTGWLVGRIIPEQESGALLQLTLVLAGTTIGASVFDTLRAIGMIRLVGRFANQSQAAVFHRILRLPTSFFRLFASGDLAMRASGIGQILQIASRRAADALLGWLFALVSLAYLFFLNPLLALVATGLTAATLAVTLATNLLRFRWERRETERDGVLGSVVFQLLRGVSKLRSTGAERRAFARWSRPFAERNEARFRLRRAQGFVESFQAGVLVANSLVLFATVAYLLPGFSTGSFVAFMSAFGQLSAATAGLAAAATELLRIVPLLERVRPILEAAPERRPSANPPGRLRGGVAATHVDFSYAPGAPLVLRDVSLHAGPGEFVAIVGPSGSGKSTLFRLLLGFEDPSRGEISFDERNLENLDREAVRRQLGVVLQNGELLPGDIATNILGSKNLPVEKAWQAAGLAGLREEIEAMPMGMQTLLSEGAETVSGGQRQRILIARALVGDPAVLLLDEATSALDNRTQARVARSLASLRVTRIVIAHRLSTVRGADRIYVLDRGQVVEAGTYEDLMAEDGVFAALARRQIA